MRRHARLPLLAAMLASLLLPTSVLAGEMAGVTLDEGITIGDQDLVLNGMGLRKVAIVKVYVAGLYLPGKQSDAAAILAADGPRGLTMAFLRSVGADSLCGGWTDGLANNTPSPSAEVEAQFETLCSYMADVEKGDRLRFAYQPGKGTEIHLNDQVKGTIEGKAFADALFACWLGPKPPGKGFKNDLLGL